MRIELNKYLQGSLTKYFWRAGTKVLLATQQPVIDLAGMIDIDDLKRRVPSLMKGQLMHDHLNSIWIRTGSIFAVDILRRLERIDKKQEMDIDYWEDYYRRYMRERSAFKLGLIMDGQTKIVNSLIDRVLAEGIEQGYGIAKIQAQMRSELINGLTEINKFQAERIARTEVIGASNTGSYDAAKESKLDMKKEWLTSGLPNVRPTHLANEALGGVHMDFEYTGGCQYPGDPNGTPDEIINCRCKPVYDVDV
jgi:hypothetical protein